MSHTVTEVSFCCCCDLVINNWIHAITYIIILLYILYFGNAGLGTNSEETRKKEVLWVSFCCDLVFFFLVEGTDNVLEKI